MREDILNKYLKLCFNAHGKQLPVEYHGYLLRVMEEYKNQPTAENKTAK